jgi:hypothetical protein
MTPFTAVYLDTVDKLGVGLRRALMNDIRITPRLAFYGRFVAKPVVSQIELCHSRREPQSQARRGFSNRITTASRGCFLTTTTFGIASSLPTALWPSVESRPTLHRPCRCGVAIPTDTRAVMLREFRRDIAALRKYGVLTRDQFKCLSREQRLLNAVERALPEFVSLDGASLTKY